MNNEITVSILCLAYNHEKYIEHSIRSICTQKADFNIEVIVNDDASTDSTKEILKKLEIEYNNLRVVYQEKNMYSQGVRMLPKLVKMARGKYVAFCEGDDFFCDEYKIKKQIEILEENNDYVACVHPAYRVRESDEKILGIRKPIVNNNCLYIDDVIKSIGHTYSLNSLVCRRDVLLDLDIDPLYYNCKVGDIPISLHIAQKGKIFYLDEIMSSYRVGAIGSWTSRISHNKQQHYEYTKSVVKILQMFNEQTECLYEECIQSKIKEFRFQNLIVNCDSQIFKGEYRGLLKKLSVKGKIKLFINYLSSAVKRGE